MVRLGHQVFCALIERRHPARTGGVDVVAASFIRGEFVLHDDGGAGGEVIRRIGGDNDQVKVGGGDACAFDGLFSRLRR